MFAAGEGFSDQSSLEKLYHDSLQQEYAALSTLKENAKKRKTAYIVSGILALLLLAGFAYYFKLFGLIVALIMIVAGYYTLQSSPSPLHTYEKRFKRDIISPIAKLVGNFTHTNKKFRQQDLEDTGLFAPAIKAFSSGDIYEKEGVKFSYITVIFDTKENASVERMAANRFEGFFIMIERTTPSEGVLVSQLLRDKVASMDMRMHSFFAKGSRKGSMRGFDIYGEVAQEERDAAAALVNEKIALSYQKDKIFIALYQASNPLVVDIYNEFDVARAREYASTFEKIESLLDSVK